MKKVILHIGAGKCGSSALQEYLSKVVHLTDGDGKQVSYVILRPDGSLLSGKKISDSARSSVYQYASSVILPNLDVRIDTESGYSELDKIPAETIIISCEGWINYPELASEKLAWLQDHQVECDVYIRPPVEWLNSAWWQWGAWCGIDFATWISKSLDSTLWVKKISKWRDLSFVDKINIRLMPIDIVVDFLNLHGYTHANRSGHENAATRRSNTSLPGSILRVYQKHPELRASPHDSRIDFTLSLSLIHI